MNIIIARVPVLNGAEIACMKMDSKWITYIAWSKKMLQQRRQ